MKKMKTTIAVALAACAATQAFALVKEDVITFSLSGQQQISVSTSAVVKNAGLWSQEPEHYRTGALKVTDQDIIKFIAQIKHGSPTYYSNKAKLVLVQGELSGFFNITPDLGVTIPQNDTSVPPPNPYYLDGIIDDGSGNGYTQDFDTQTDIANSHDSSYVALANGHHFQTNAITSDYPVGHNQPWGQIYIKDIGKSGYSAASPLCENVTYYFALSVEECYDCFYMNSFISDADFSTKVNTQSSVPPCCGHTTSALVGKGRDRYYLTFSFDNTVNNPYLNPQSGFWTGNYDGSHFEIGFGPISSPAGPIPGDGLVPDQINNNNGIGVNGYDDHITRQNQFSPQPYEARFTLNGIVTYAWNLKFINTSDIAPDFVGLGTYAANGYGFIGLVCGLFAGNATFTERTVSTACCLDNGPWYDTYGSGAGGVISSGGWYAPGAEYYDDGSGNINTKYSAGGYETPINTGASLTYHHNFDLTYGWAQNNWAAGWPTPAVIAPVGIEGGINVGWNNFDLNQP